MENQINILHLTDIHISSTEKTEEIRKKWEILIEQVKSLTQNVPDLVAVTGDITAHGEKSEYGIGINYLNWLAEVCHIPTDRFIFCPGNHDADKTCINSTFQNYGQFLDDYYEVPLGNSVEKNPSFELQNCKKKVRVWQVNTNQTTSYIFYDNASIPVKEADIILQNLVEDDYNILLMHHQPSCIDNQEILKRVCEKMNLVLCGHLHPNRPIINVCRKATIVTGIAFTPHLATLQKGCQIVTCLNENVTVKPIIINNDL